MPDLFDYLKWRADVPFSADPFNEVDNMILSELAYTCFEDMPSFETEIPVKQVCDSFFAVHTREEMLSINSYTAKSSLLMDGMISGARFCDTRLLGYINEIDKENDKQISAVTYILDDGTVVALITREEYFSVKTEQFVDDTFGGSLPAFIAAFTSHKKLSQSEVDEIQKLIDAYKTEG